MPEFQYVARAHSGQQVTGNLSAANEQDALTTLAAQSLFPIRIGPAESEVVVRKRMARGVGARHLAVFYSQLSDLLRSGVPLLRSLELLQRQATNSTLKSVLDEVRGEVADGTSLANAMSHHPRIFNELNFSMVRAGEEGSFLEDVLKRIADFTEHQQDLKSRVFGAMVYPVFLLVMGTIIITAMLVFFVPKFSPIFAKMEARGQLHWTTNALIATSDAAQEYWFVGLILLTAGGIALVSWSKTEAGRMQVDRFRLWAPGLGVIIRSLAISRFSRILGTLMQNGVPILQSLRIAKDATGNVVLSEAIASAAENISAGKSLAQPLGSSGHFPDEIVEMVAVGEEANNLEQVLIDIADNLERRTQRQLDMFVRMLEPVLLTLMAGVVLFLVLALLWPILQSSGLL